MSVAHARGIIEAGATANEQRPVTAQDFANRHLEFLLSSVFDRSDLHPEHLTDLRKSGLTDETIWAQKIRTVMPPSVFDQLLGFRVPGEIASMYVLPYFDLMGQLTDHVRVRVFPPMETPKGTVKYLQPRGSRPRLFFPLASRQAVRHSEAPLWIVEGEKKSLAVAQTGRAVIGLAGIDGWHLAGTRELHPDFDDVGLRGRVVKVVPDADVRTNPRVHGAVQRLGLALTARGATVQVVRVPDGYKGIDDWLAAESAR